MIYISMMNPQIKLHTKRKYPLVDNSLLKNTHKGERCFVVASGKSTLNQDLGWLKNEITIGVNQSYLVTEPYGYHPTYMCLIDRGLYVNIKEIYEKLSSKTAFVLSNYNPKKTDTGSNYKGVNAVAVVNRINKWVWEGNFDSDLSSGVYRARNVVIDLAIPMAIYMGCSEVYLIGCDCTEDGYGYSYANDLGNGQRISKRIFKSYSVVKKYAEQHSVKIFNAGKGGKLEEFDRIELETMDGRVIVETQQVIPLVSHKQFLPSSTCKAMAYFSYPSLGNPVLPDSSLYSKLKDIFSLIKPDTKVRAAMYMWNQDLDDRLKSHKGNPLELTNLFIDNTGSDVEVILDSYNLKFENTINRFKDKFGDKLHVDSKKKESDPAYRKEIAKQKKSAEVGYMHDKFFLFSSLEGIGNYIVLQMTGNINTTQYFQFNNMVVLSDDKVIYDRYLQHWKSLKTSVDMVPINSVYDDSGVYFFPRKKCPLEQELELYRGKCCGLKIDLAMCFFSRGGIAKIMEALKGEGAKIRVIFSKEYENRIVLRRLRSAGIAYKVIDNKGWKGRMHHKFATIQGEESVVWTGSYNLTNPGLKLNDETLLKISDKSLFQQYSTEFSKMWKNPHVTDWIHG